MMGVGIPNIKLRACKRRLTAENENNTIVTEVYFNMIVY